MTPIVPIWAARIWIEDDCLHLDLPAIGSSYLSHRLTFPNDQQGLIRALHMLQQRTAISRIAEPGDLTQWQVDKQLRTKVDITGKPITKVKPKDAFAPALRQSARDVLRRLGLT